MSYFTIARGTRIRPTGSACQPEPDSPARTAYEVLPPVFVGLCIASFDNRTGPSRCQKHARPLPGLTTFPVRAV